MTTRRDFLHLIAVIPFVGTFRLPFLITGDNSMATTPSDEEPLYIGKPLSYWMKDPEDDLAECDLKEDWAIQEFGESAIPKLIQAMRNTGSSFACHMFIVMMQELPPGTSVPIIMDILKCKDPDVQNTALIALHWIIEGREEQAQTRDSLRRAIPGIVNALTCVHDQLTLWLGLRVMDMLRPPLGSDVSFASCLDGCTNPYLWTLAIREHPQHFQAEKVVPALIANLEHPDLRVRRMTAMALSVHCPKHPAVVSAFVDQLRDRAGCRFGFKNIDRYIEQALPVIRQIIADAASDRREQIVENLVWYCSDMVAIEPIFVECLHDDSERVRRLAIQGLSDLKHSETQAILIEALQDQCLDVRQLARSKFMGQTDMIISALPELTQILESGNTHGKISAAIVLSRVGQKAIPALSALRNSLRHSDPDVRLAAAIALARIDAPKDDLLPDLVTGVAHSDRDLRICVIHELSRVGKAALFSLPAIIQGVDGFVLPFYLDNDSDDSELVRELFVDGLLKDFAFDAAPIVPALIELLRVRDTEQARLAMSALAMIGLPAIGPLIQIAHGNDALYVRRRAIEALGRIGPPAKAIIPLLVKLLGDDSVAIRITAAEGLGRMGPDAAVAIPALESLLGDRDLLLRRRAQEALECIRNCRVSSAYSP
jgi:HEAT repeat protein